MEEKEKANLPMDPKQIQETLDKLCNIARSIAKVIADTFSEFWGRIGGDVILQYKKLYEESQWIYLSYSQCNLQGFPSLLSVLPEVLRVP